MAKNWFEKLGDQIKKMTNLPPPFDPSGIQDPLAQKTSWQPLSPGGKNFRSHRLVSKGPYRLEYKATLFSVFFGLIFVVVGLGVSTVFLFKVPGGLSSGSFQIQMIIPVFVGTMFALVGGHFVYTGLVSIVFDRQKNLFWKGKEPAHLNAAEFYAPQYHPDTNELPEKNYASLNDIKALQILSEYCRGNKSSYYSYEINLVLKDGSRLNVVDQADLKKLREEAQVIGQFLNVPIWDGA